MKTEARIQRKKKRIKDHNDKMNGVYYMCHGCNKQFKVSVCPECGGKLKGAYCKIQISNYHKPLLGDDGDPF